MYKQYTFAQKYPFGEYSHRVKLVISLKHAERYFYIDECEL